MKANVNLNSIRKEMKTQNGTFFQCVNFLYSYENCQQLKKVLPPSKNKAKTEEHESECKKFVKFGEILTRKVSKNIDGVRCTTEITYTKNTISVDEVLRYFIAKYNGTI